MRIDHKQIELRLQGIGASPGIAISRALVLQREEMAYTFYRIDKKQIKKEVARFRVALSKAKVDMQRTRLEVLKVLGKSHAKLIDVQMMILEDPAFTVDVEEGITSDLINAESSLVASLDKLGRTFEKLEDEFFRQRKDDVMDVGRKLMALLVGRECRRLNDLNEKVIVVAHDLSPSDTLSMRGDMVKGFVTDIGGRTSHTAIVAQGLGIPAVVGLKEVTASVNTGDVIIIDGQEGVVLIRPSQVALDNYRRVQQVREAETRSLRKLRDLPAETKDGHRIELSANIESQDELKSVHDNGAEGIGLYRTEFLYLNRETLPKEEEHYQNYSLIASQIVPYSAIIRTYDLGGDKLAPMGVGEIQAKEPNPALGLRAIRLSLTYPDLLITQLRAILRASVRGKLKILYPMILGLEELRAANAYLEQVKKELRMKRVPFDEKIEVGAMIEVPSAAMIADLISKEVDFLSIGTNDLVQYMLAVDRGNGNVATLYNPAHLAVMRLLKIVVDAAHANDRWVGVCGDMAGDTAFTLMLLGLGIDELSVPAPVVPRIKEMIRSHTLAEAKALAAEVLASTDPAFLQKKLHKRP